jgi:hypothetical protein
MKDYLGEGIVMVQIIEILKPIVEEKCGEYGLARRCDALVGKTIGLLENKKPNADVFISRIAELLKNKYTDSNQNRHRPSRNGSSSSSWGRKVL